MKKKLILFLFILICFILQTTVLKYISFAGIIPNIMVVAIASFGFMNGRKTGLILGFICGFMIDVLYGSFFGFHALIYMLVGYGNGIYRRAFYPEDLKLPVILILLSDLFVEFATYVFGFLFRGRIDFGQYVIQIFLPSLIYTMLAVFVMYPIILALNHYFENLHKRSARKFGEETEE